MAYRSDGKDGALQNAACTADYIADMTKELAGVARGARLDVLAYLLDVANLEASEKAGRREETSEPLQVVRSTGG